MPYFLSRACNPEILPARSEFYKSRTSGLYYLSKTAVWNTDFPFAFLYSNNDVLINGIKVKEFWKLMIMTLKHLFFIMDDLSCFFKSNYFASFTTRGLLMSIIWSRQFYAQNWKVWKKMFLHVLLHKIELYSILFSAIFVHKTTKPF